MMTVDEAIIDEARRYAVALLAEGRERLRAFNPSVPGPLVAELFWQIEASLPHLSRCALERLILDEDNSGAGWRRYTVARQRPEDEARYWKSWPQTRQRMALTRDLHDRKILERRSHETKDELLEIQPIFQSRPALGNNAATFDDSLSRPLFKGRVPLEIHCKDRLRLHKETPDQLTNMSPQATIDDENAETDDRITGPLPVDVQCHLSSKSCLSHLDCPHRQLEIQSGGLDGSPITFRRLYHVLFEAHTHLAELHRERSGGDEDRLAHLLNWQRATLLSQLRVLSAWRACHRVLRKKLLRGEKFQIDREIFEREFAAIEQYNLRCFQ